jgi:hypothetical protein
MHAHDPHLTDLCFPHGNEEALCQMALALGTTHLILCYPLSDPLVKDRKKEVAMLAHEGLTTEFAVIVRNQDEVAKAMHLTRTIVGPARLELYEDKRVTHLIGIESGRREDFIHHRNSGLTQVLIAQAIRTEKTLLVDLSALHGPFPQPVIIGRIMQNNTLFKKYAPRTLVVSAGKTPFDLRSPHDRANFLRI